MDKIQDGDQYEMTDELRWLFVTKIISFNSILFYFNL